MALAQVFTRAQLGIESPLVSVEVHLSNGLPSLALVGLPETAVKESKERVRSAILNSQFEFPTKRITINLAPADLPKEGGRYDLAIAIGILAASEQIPKEHLSRFEFLGELGLAGKMQSVSGVLPSLLAANKDKRILIAPKANEQEAALCQNSRALMANHLLEVSAHLHRQSPLGKPVASSECLESEAQSDLRDVRGQPQAKRALEIAAAGNHNLLFIGPPGSGKTMLASRLPSILPTMSEQQALEVAAIYSISQTQQNWIKQWQIPPFRAPHHTASGVALVGGGSRPKPGEISLAHSGVLFLDELPEYGRKVLDVLREPLESGHIVISRANNSVTFPAKFQLVAAMNPCPCGYYGDAKGRCHCSREQVKRYQNQASGPLLDRIDLQIGVPPVSPAVLQELPEGESSFTVRARVLNARDRQLQRQGCVNAQLKSKALEQVCKLKPVEQTWLLSALETLNISARGYHRILSVARSIADLAESDDIEKNHLAEAIGFRSLDRYLS